MGKVRAQSEESIAEITLLTKKSSRNSQGPVISSDHGGGGDLPDEAVESRLHVCRLSSPAGATPVPVL